jgi:hypothetical protein
MARKQSREALETELAAVKHERDYLWLYLNDNGHKEPVCAKVNKAETEHQDEWLSAEWFRADGCDEGYVVICQRYGQGNQHNTWIMPWAKLAEVNHDYDLMRLRERLQHARFESLRAA